MLTGPKDPLVAAIDKENDLQNTPTLRAKAHLSKEQSIKRSFNSISTPLNSQTPGPVHKSIALRDITNSAVAPKTFDALKRETKHRDMASEPTTIEELLALPDELLPEIETVPSMPPALDDNEDLPEIIDLASIKPVGISSHHEEQVNDILSGAERSKEFLRHRLQIAIEAIRVRPEEFEWTTLPLPQILEEQDEGSSGGCYMFNDLPDQIY